MFVLLILFFSMLLGGVTVAQKNEFYADYCSPQNTARINAVFSILIFFSHVTSYVTLKGDLNVLYFDFRNFVGQGVVVTYLFYSGYGIMESISKKGLDYVKSIPTKRFFKLWYHFAIVIAIYAVVGIAIGRKFQIDQILLSLIGYKSIGNSNWYLFVTFASYIFIFVAFMIFRKKKIFAVGMVFVLTVLLMFLEYKLELPERFYNTVICLPIGMVFSMVKPYVEKVITKHDIVWFTTFSGLLLIVSYFALNRKESLVYYLVYMIAFVLLIVVSSMKINVKNSILDWFGAHIFSFFILQRIPMIILQYLGFNKEPYIFVLLSFFATVFLSLVFDESMNRLDKIIYKPKKNKG